MTNRRAFLKITGGTAALLLASRRGYAYASSPTNLRKFQQALPALGAGLPVATPAANPLYPNSDFYRIAMIQYSQQMHPDLPGETKLWGYSDITTNAAGTRGYLGPVIVAKRGRPVRVRWVNRLPSTHILPVDKSLMGAERGQAENRTAPHLHGGFVPWNSDGGPLQWFTPAPNPANPATVGPDYNPNPYNYPNDQSGRLMWYHDHALGITRLNAYAGLAAPYVLRDELEQALRLPAGPPFEVPLVIQDKTFTATGALWYPSVYEPDRWEYNPPPGAPPLPVPSVVAEFFGDTTVVNGAAYPYLNVQRRRYRFRILNGAQARFYNLQLYYEGAAPGEANLSRSGPIMLQIGNETGLLPLPVVLNAPPRQIGFDTNRASPTFGNVTRYTLLLAPAERADVLIDFSNVPAGSRLILYNDAPAPFPGGDTINDHDSASVEDPMHREGFGPNTRTILQFRVAASGLATANAPTQDTELNSLANALNQQPQTTALAATAAVRVRDLTLNEDFDQFGRLIQQLGTNVMTGMNSQGMPAFGRAFDDPATETPRAGDIEVWRIFNLTGDTHPMHFHLVNVNVLGRRPFNVATYRGTPTFTGPMRGPDLNELGGKETVRMNPNEMTTVIMKFDLPRVPTDVSRRTNGHNYVWHCHILEHEEHDMMRPLIVKA